MIDDMNSLATRRSRRSTAGNRMEAALAEMALDESMKDMDDDKEFVNVKDEADIFESDFASTDEEAGQEDVDAGEKAVYDEEKSARKAARSRLEKRTAAAHAKHRATFNPQAIAPPVIKSKRQPSVVTTIPTSEPGTSDLPRRAGQKRKSQRRHTVLNTTATDSRMRETEEKKASAPKKYKPIIRSFTQAQLIQRALDNEEGNIKEHRNYLEVEEEKRKKARAIKMPVVEGPLLRWISKAEEEKFKVQVEVTPPQTTQTIPAAPTYAGYTAAQLNVYYAQLYQYLASQTSTLTGTTQTGSGAQSVSGQTLTSQLATVSNTPSSTTTPSTTLATSTAVTQASAAAFSTFRLPNAASPYPYTYYTPAATSSMSVPTPSIFTPSLFVSTTVPAPSQLPPKQYVEEERAEDVTKNYVVVEADQQEGIPKPPWKDMMKAMFGDHAQWDELKVLSGKGRPLARVKQLCPITGEVAPYMDPRTGVPFADVAAYKTLSSLLEHEYIWSPELGCYVGRDQARHIQ